MPAREGHGVVGSTLGAIHPGILPAFHAFFAKATVSGRMPRHISIAWTRPVLHLEASSIPCHAPALIVPQTSSV